MCPGRSTVKTSRGPKRLFACVLPGLRFVWARNKLPTSYFLLLRFTLGGGARTTDRANAPPKGRPISLAVRKQRALASPSARLPRRLTLAGAGVGPAPTGSLLARCPCRSPRRPRRANAAHAAGRRLRQAVHRNALNCLPYIRTYRDILFDIQYACFLHVHVHVVPHITSTE